MEIDLVECNKPDTLLLYLLPCSLGSGFTLKMLHNCPYFPSMTEDEPSWEKYYKLNGLILLSLLGCTSFYVRLLYFTNAHKDRKFEIHLWRLTYSRDYNLNLAFVFQLDLCTFCIGSKDTRSSFCGISPKPDFCRDFPRTCTRWQQKHYPQNSTFWEL